MFFIAIDTTLEWILFKSFVVLGYTLSFYITIIIKIKKRD